MNRKLRLKNYRCEICGKAVFICALYVLEFGPKKSAAELFIRCHSFRTNSKCRMFGKRALYFPHKKIFIADWEKKLVNLKVEKRNLSS